MRLCPLSPPLRQVILAVRQNPLSRCAQVFGSMARAHPSPKGLDLLVSLPGVRHPNVGNAADYPALYDLLTIARRWYGYLDPFVWNGRSLWVRNADATSYERARIVYREVVLVPFARLFALYQLE
jgi:hypothetical protein